MRKIYWFLWVCCLGAALVACSNDDDEPGVVLPGGDGGIIGEIPGGDNIWPEGVRRVKRIGELSKLGLPQDLMHIEYVNQFVKGYWVISGGVFELDFKMEVSNSAVEVFTTSQDYGTSRIALTDGRVTSMVCNVGDDYRSQHDSCYCSYENGYLKRMIVKSFYSYDEGLTVSDEKHYDFTFTAGNFSASKCLMQGYGDATEETVTFSYSKEIRNDANMDLSVLLREYLLPSSSSYGKLVASDISCLGMFGFTGERSKSLPVKITCDSGNGDSQEWNISYETDDEGYPTCMRIEEKGSGEVSTLCIYY